jgi:hypothetical protein
LKFLTLKYNYSSYLFLKLALIINYSEGRTPQKKEEVRRDEN